jgi:hypothetical protein
MIYIIFEHTSSSESSLDLKLAPTHTALYLIFFYQINKDDKIRTRDHLIIKALIPC